MTDSGGGPRAPGDEDRPPRSGDGSEAPPSPTDAPVRWYLQTTDPLVVASRDVLTSVALVLLVGLTLFAISGVWPPMVAIESGSMEPNMHQGDLVIVVEEDRFTSELADERGIVTHDAAAGSDHERFGRGGSVIVYQPDGSERTPIIHRAVLYVEEGENWVDRADPQYLAGADSCDELEHCPAPHDGYVTRGDANPEYDQVGGFRHSGVVREEWVNGRAVARIPYLGCIRLELSESPSCWEDDRRTAAP